MSDKGLAGIYSFFLIAPLVALCCLGPAALFSGIAALISWISGNGTGTTIALALLAAAVGIYYRTKKKRQCEPSNEHAGREHPQQETH